MSLGPVAVNALLLTSSLYPSVASLPAETRLPTYLSLVFTTTLLTGIFSLAMGLFRLGLAVTFVGPPVMEGFTMGSIILIGLSQLEPLLGYSTGPPQPYIVPQLINTFSNIRKTQPAALVLGLVSIAILLTLGKFRYTAWIPRPLFVTVVMTLISWGIHVNTTWGLPIVGDVPRGLPSLIIPTLDASTIAQCAVPAILLAILGFMQSFAVALRFAEKRGYTVQPNQELAALGITHILSSFTQSMDSTGSYSRTSVKANAGARTQISGLFELILLILTLQFLTSLFYYIPKSALAAIVMAAVINMFEPAGFRRMLRTKPRDFWVAVLTALITVFTSSQYGLLAGVAMSLFLIVWRSSHPPHAVLGLVSFPAPEGTVPVQSYRNVERYPEARQEPGIMVWRFDAELWFANVNYFREKLQGELAKRRVQRTPKWAGREEVVFDNTGIGLGIREAEEEEDDDRVRVLVLDMTSIVDVDSSGAQALLALNSTLRKSQGIEVLFAGVKGPVRDVLWRATEGRILPDDMIAGKGKKEKAAKPAAEVATGNGEVTDPTASQIQVIPDEPPNDRPNEPGIPMIAFEDRNGKVTLVPHPAPETLARAAPSPSVPRRGWKVPPNATIVGSTWGRNVTATDLYVEQFFLSVAGAVEFAKRLVARQKAKEAKTRMGVV